MPLPTNAAPLAKAAPILAPGTGATNKPNATAFKPTIAASPGFSNAQSTKFFLSSSGISATSTVPL